MLATNESKGASLALLQRDHHLEPYSDDEVQALEPLHFYTVLKELGLEDGASLLLHASTEQVRTVVDLDIWDGATLVYDDMAQYVSAAFASDPETLWKVVDAVDSELLVAFLRSRVRLYELHGEDAPPAPRYEGEQQLPRFATPDGYYLVEDLVLPPSDELDPVRFVDLLYRKDPDEALRLMFAVRWELSSPLEEQAYQFKSARLEDLGFPAGDRAAQLYTPLADSDKPPAAPALDNHGPQTLPAQHLAGLDPASLFVTAVRAMADTQLAASVEQQLIFLINAASVAEGVLPGQFEQVAQLARRVTGYLSIGLGERSGADPLLCAQALTEVPLRWLFRRGFGATWKLARRSAQLRGALEQAGILEQLPDTDQALLEALIKRRPGYLPPNEFIAEMAEPFGSFEQVVELGSRLDALSERVPPP